MNQTFEEFLNELAERIPTNERTLSFARPPVEHPIQSLFVTHDAPSEELVRFLTDDVEYLYKGMAVESSRPALFYSGSDLGWYPIADGLNVHRSLGDKLRSAAQLTPEEDRPAPSELVVLKGEAGSGKTVILRQAAWDAKDAGLGAVLWVQSLGDVDIDILQEIYRATKERILLFWDNAANNVRSIERLFHKAARQSLPLTIITAERFSEWNNRCTGLDELVTLIFEVRYLNESEIEQLVELLDKSNCLGPNLEKKSHDERVRELREVHGRQLLVALHEATMGKRFEDIIGDEYRSIEPKEAKLLYRTVCTLNRLRVPVRAGLIGRIYGIAFDDFKSRLHKPLERVVLWEGQNGADAHYVARHPDIAEIVFEQAFVDSDDRFNEYARILDKINISYQSDRMSFRGLLRAKKLTEVFPEYQDVSSIYIRALEKVGRDSYLLQQMANFERIRPNGSLESARELLAEARSVDPLDESIVHSLAVVWRDMASEAGDSSIRGKRRSEARSLLYGLREREGHTPYIDGTLVELALADLQDALSDDKISERVIDEAMRRAEAELGESKRRFPGDGYLFKLEADLARTLRDSQRAKDALERAFRENDRDPLIAARLAALYEDAGDAEKALDVLGRALDRRRADRRLHFYYGEILRRVGADKSELSYHYRRAYTPGDRNYEAKFWDARYAIESDDPAERNRALDIFRELQRSRISYAARSKVRDLMGGWSAPTRKFGTLYEKKDRFGFVQIDGWGMSVYASEECMDPEVWEMLEAGDRVKCYVGYTYQGARCHQAELV
ncbi:ATP-binding protein [Sediminicurvatus halobius]|uniref:ATP-binding protein n=1 Tax=Sediminicurvatus halobius TaxID=2182432 RepID=UPI0011B224C2|nr:ATP-binding protein [Spiribacter halobius]UEX78019.1 ATP-binding protein [Spiribacter halobius]